MLFPTIQSFLDKAAAQVIPENRLPVLNTLVDYCKAQTEAGKVINLNFICTHNSRRSQFSQVWAQTIAALHGIEANCYSGGVEVTAFNERAIASIQRTGFKVSSEETENPKYSIRFSDAAPSILVFSKVFDDATNPTTNFAAVMTCSDADENCPFIPGADARIPLRFEDPKAFDDTELETQMYDERSLQIASELGYVFGRLV